MTFPAALHLLRLSPEEPQPARQQQWLWLSRGPKVPCGQCHSEPRALIIMALDVTYLLFMVAVSSR